MDVIEQKVGCLIEKEIVALVSFQSILRRIHNRLINDGYIIKDGKIIDPKFVESRSQLC